MVNDIFENLIWITAQNIGIIGASLLAFACVEHMLSVILSTLVF